MLKRTPEPDDATVLHWAGAFGHQFVVTIVDERGRRVVCENNTLSSATRCSWDYPDRNPRVFERKRTGGWRRVK